MEIEPRVTRDIYGMPAFLSLTVADVEASVDWYVNGLDFVSLFTLPGPDSAPALVHLRRWRYQDILVRPGRSQAGTGLTFSVLAEHGQLDQLAERARRHGGGTVEGPLDTPWNTRDLRTVDPHGFALVFTARRPADQRDERFGGTIERLSREQLG